MLELTFLVYFLAPPRSGAALPSILNSSENYISSCRLDRSRGDSVIVIRLHRKMAGNAIHIEPDQGGEVYDLLFESPGARHSNPTTENGAIERRSEIRIDAATAR